MTAFKYGAPVGAAGDVTRMGESNIEPARLIAIGGVFAAKFGIPMKYATGGISQINTGDAATVFAGILIREVPQMGASLASDSAAFPDGGVPNPAQITGLLVRGYCNVKVFAGTPARGGVVYMQVTANGGAVPGDLRADGTDGGNAVALTATQATWASDGKDADGIAEIRVAR